MEKINFINGQAPALNSTNLNQLQTNVENAINGVDTKAGNLEDLSTNDTSNLVNAINELRDGLYYKSGDSYQTIEQAIYVGGTVTGGTKSLNFTIPVPKSLKNITKVNINSMTLLVRTTAGAYLNSASGGIMYGSTSGITYNTFISSENTILIQLVSDSAYTNVTNNTPLNVAVSSLQLTFE